MERKRVWVAGYAGYPTASGGAAALATAVAN